MAAANWFRYSVPCPLLAAQGQSSTLPIGKAPASLPDRRNRHQRFVARRGDDRRSPSGSPATKKCGTRASICSKHGHASRPPLSLKETYRVLRATDANVRLVPGVAAASLAAAANAHQNTDFILIGPDVSESDRHGAWFYVPRMLHRNVDHAQPSAAPADGQPTFTRLTRSQIAEWACQETVRHGRSFQASARESSRPSCRLRLALKLHSANSRASPHAAGVGDSPCPKVGRQSTIDSDLRRILPRPRTNRGSRQS